MKTNFDIEKLVEGGSINNPLDYERALVADRTLRLLSKESSHFKNLRLKLRDLIEHYEGMVWSKVESITKEDVLESDKSAKVAETERLFIEKRKVEIRKKLKELDLSQEDLALLLGHKSKTHMSELMNGIKPFKLKDLIIINRVLKVELSILIPVYLSKEDQNKVREALRQLDKPNIRLSSEDLLIQSF